MREGHKIRDRYELLEVAGRGGMAVVWRAIQHGSVGFQRTVAVKQMHQHLEDSELYVRMFAEEARVCSTLSSPNIAHVFDFIEEDGHYYLVLEWIAGIDLGSYIRYFNDREEPMPWEHAVAVGVGMLRALADAHERLDADGKAAPILHRDISPHNILVTHRGLVKLIDWGLSLALDRNEDLTEPGIVKGKMSYLSPEIAAGARPDVASDQFAVGSVLWEMLVGKRLFDGESDFDVYAKLRGCQVPPLRALRKDVPKAVVSIINRALAPRIDQRYPSTREMGKALSHTLKSVRSARDLHAILARTAMSARESLELGDRTGEPSTTTPIADTMIDSVDLNDLTPTTARKRAATDPIPVAGNVAEDGGRRGLLHRIAALGRRR